jgi:hypothetical protein
VKAKRKNKRVGGAAKGGQFERSMCTMYGLWWTEGSRDDIFWRTSGSGARATTRGRSGKKTADQTGDMTHIDPVGKPLIDVFCFEFKFYRTYDMLGVLQPVDVNVDWMQFWAKCYDDAMSVARRPFLVTKRNRGALLGWVTAATSIEFQMIGFKPAASMVLRISERVVEVKRREVRLPEHAVVGFRLAQFFDVVDPRALEAFYAGRGCSEAQRDASAAQAGDCGEAAEGSGRGAGEAVGEAD